MNHRIISITFYVVCVIAVIITFFHLCNIIDSSYQVKISLIATVLPTIIAGWVYSFKNPSNNNQKLVISIDNIQSLEGYIALNRLIQSGPSTFGELSNHIKQVKILPGKINQEVGWLFHKGLIDIDPIPDGCQISPDAKISLLKNLRLTVKPNAKGNSN